MVFLLSGAGMLAAGVGLLSGLLVTDAIGNITGDNNYGGACSSFVFLHVEPGNVQISFFLFGSNFTGGVATGLTSAGGPWMCISTRRVVFVWEIAGESIKLVQGCWYLVELGIACQRNINTSIKLSVSRVGMFLWNRSRLYFSWDVWTGQFTTTR